jgi:ribosomal protein S12 methylthiotransferase accessory factor
MTALLPATVPVVGTGFLAGFLADRLADEHGADHGENHAGVLVADLDRLADHDDTLVDCLATGRPLLFVGAWRSMVYVGPFWTPGRPGCPRCLVSRTANSAYGPDLRGDTVLESRGRDTGVSTLGPAVLAIVAHHVAARLAHGPDGDRVIVVEGSTGCVERQALLPDSTCPTCARPPDSTVPVFTDAPLTKPDPSSPRTAELDPRLVERDYLCSGIGLFKEVRQDLQSPFGACSVELPTRWGGREPAIGRAGTYRTGRIIAVLEGLERYAGLHRGGRRAAVRAAYADVADRALHPPLLGTHPADSYAAEGFQYRPFHPDTVVDWVWAYSFRQRGPILVPERAAFWGPRHDGEVSFYYDTSNGCALGNSTEEAILHGLREVAERDSYLLTWYRRLALPEVTLAGADRELDDLLGKSTLFTGFGFRCFESTMEHGMPSFWLLAQRQGDDGPTVLTGSAAHPDPVRAVTGGLHELVGTILAATHGYPDRRAEGLRMLADPTLVRRMPDHSLVGSLPEARSRYAFLTDGDHDVVELSSVAGTIRTDTSDLRADLDVAVDGMLGAGFDVLVVDQTMPESGRNGLRCVRVIVPGLVPMTFGHVNRRTRDLPRLTEGVGVPYRGQLADDEEVGCVPHPFP